MAVALPEVDEQVAGLGGRIRALRLERQLTLAELSEKSQVSVGMLSHIERGKASPSLKTLEKVRLALAVPLARLFDESTSTPERAVVARAAQRSTLEFREWRLTKELLSPPGYSDMEMLVLSIGPGGSSGPDPWRRVGEKGGLVLQGRFELQVGDQCYVLEEGDSFQFDSSQPHAFRNLANGVTRVVWVIKSSEAG